MANDGHARSFDIDAPSGAHTASVRSPFVQMRKVKVEEPKPRVDDEFSEIEEQFLTEFMELVHEYVHECIERHPEMLTSQDKMNIARAIQRVIDNKLGDILHARNGQNWRRVRSDSTLNAHPSDLFSKVVIEFSKKAHDLFVRYFTFEDDFSMQEKKGISDAVERALSDFHEEVLYDVVHDIELSYADFSEKRPEVKTPLPRPTLERKHVEQTTPHRQILETKVAEIFSTPVSEIFLPKSVAPESAASPVKDEVEEAQPPQREVVPEPLREAVVEPAPVPSPVVETPTPIEQKIEVEEVREIHPVDEVAIEEAAEEAEAKREFDIITNHSSAPSKIVEERRPHISRYITDVSPHPLPILDKIEKPLEKTVEAPKSVMESFHMTWADDTEDDEEDTVQAPEPLQMDMPRQNVDVSNFPKTLAGMKAKAKQIQEKAESTIESIESEFISDDFNHNIRLSQAFNKSKIYEVASLNKRQDAYEPTRITPADLVRDLVRLANRTKKVGHFLMQNEKHSEELLEECTEDFARLSSARRVDRPQ